MDLGSAQPTPAAEPANLHPSGGGSTSGGRKTRVTRLETQMEIVRRDLDEIKESLGTLPTLGAKRDLANFSLAGIGIAVAAIGLVIGGLGWLETRGFRVQSAAVAPILLQLPTTPSVFAGPAPLANGASRR